jgi:hypothetical protein
MDAAGVALGLNEVIRSECRPLPEVVPSPDEDLSRPSMRRPVRVKYVFLSCKDVFVLLFLAVSSCP